MYKIERAQAAGLVVLLGWVRRLATYDTVSSSLAAVQRFEAPCWTLEVSDARSAALRVVNDRDEYACPRPD
jgi:hypothetical protein